MRGNEDSLTPNSEHKPANVQDCDASGYYHLHSKGQQQILQF